MPLVGDPPAIAAASIAEIREGDLSAVAALHACCFDEPWRPELIGRIAQAPGGFGLLWRCEDEPLGFVLGRTNHARAEVLSLGVAPPARERGIARALMHAAIDWVSRRDLRALYLEVAEDNSLPRCVSTVPWDSLPSDAAPAITPDRRPKPWTRSPCAGRSCRLPSPARAIQAGLGAQKRFLIGGESLPLIARETPSAIAIWQASAISLRERNCSMVTGG